MDFEKDLEINKFVLDDEWVKQPGLFYKWGKGYAESLLERDRLKSKLELVRAELDSKIRKNPAAFGIDKPTETAISNIIITLKEYTLALEECNKAVYNLSVMNSAREAMEHKRSALDNLTKLFLADYWVEGKKVPKETEEMVNKKTDSKMREGLKRGKEK